MLQWYLDPSNLDTTTNQMQLASRTELATDAKVLEGLPDVVGISYPELRRQIVRRLRMERDWTMCGLMNAITSLARNTHGPSVHWDLEELGGGVPALVEPRIKSGGMTADRVDMLH